LRPDPHRHFDRQPRPLETRPITTADWTLNWREPITLSQRLAVRAEVRYGLVYDTMRATAVRSLAELVEQRGDPQPGDLPDASGASLTSLLANSLQRGQYPEGLPDLGETSPADELYSWRRLEEPAGLLALTHLFVVWVPDGGEPWICSHALVEPYYTRTVFGWQSPLVDVPAELADGIEPPQGSPDVMWGIAKRYTRECRQMWEERAWRAKVEHSAEMTRQHIEALHDAQVARRGDKPPLRLLRNARDAEESACDWMRWLGYPDARVTRQGADGGVDVTSTHAVAQVKAQTAPTGRPDVQRIAGVAAAASKAALFFSLGGYTAAARSWGEQARVGLFRFDLQGSPEPVSSMAQTLWDMT
jgi:hypothetical protein